MRRPLIGVRRDRATLYLSLTIAAFAVTVVGVRMYLDAAGYPSVGGGGLHVAHMLWGGLLLVIAAVLVQLYVGRRTLIISALAAGVGVGLFIDEVGKFITESNDYFFAPAAPIIYGAILLLVLLWFVLRRADRPSLAEATQGAIEAVRDLADGRLSIPARDRAVARLEAAGITGAEPELPGELLRLLRSPVTEARLNAPAWHERGAHLVWLRRLMPDRLERFLVRLGLLFNTLATLVWLLVLWIVVDGTMLDELPTSSGPTEFPDDPLWIALLGLVWIVVGLASAVALVASVFRRHRPAMALAQYALLLALVAGGLLDVYVSQIGALADVLLQLVLLAMVLDQRSRLAAAEDEAKAAADTAAKAEAAAEDEVEAAAAAQSD
jgi:hypothetical protein